MTFETTKIVHTLLLLKMPPLPPIVNNHLCWGLLQGAVKANGRVGDGIVESVIVCPHWEGWGGWSRWDCSNKWRWLLLFLRLRNGNHHSKGSAEIFILDHRIMIIDMMKIQIMQAL